MGQDQAAPDMAYDIYERAENSLIAHEQACGSERFSEEELAAEREALARLIALRNHMSRDASR